MSILRVIFRLLVLAVWMVVAGPVTVLRILRYGDTQIDDFLYYPAREMAASPTPYQFASDPGSPDIGIIVPVPAGAESDLDTLLQANDTIALLYPGRAYHGRGLGG